MNDTELYHYGVKGMKWGVRKARYAEKNVRLAKYDESRANLIGKQNTRTATERLKNVNTINSLKANKDRAGVKAEKKRYRLDSTIQVHKDNKQLNKLHYDYIVNEAKIRRAQQSDRFAKLKDANFNRKLREYRREYEKTVKIDDYYIAKAKAKKDPAYKDSAEYKTHVSEGRKEIGKVYAQAFIQAMLYG